jgi:hypothetical protein
MLTKGDAVKTFKLLRTKDVSGTSGTGMVAVGIEVGGQVLLTWVVLARLGSGMRQIQTLTLFESIQDVQDLHGHGDSTQVVLDGEFDFDTMDLIESLKYKMLAA